MSGASGHWKRRAARLAEGVPVERLHPAVVAWAARSPKNERWAVAMSGGADSLALLLLLWAHWPERRQKLLVLHFDHRLRGAASTADARFCAQVASGLGVSFVCGRWEFGRALSSEAGARSARFAFFSRTLKPRKIRALWLGHQQDDIAETLFMRIARGSGPAGLAAPRPVGSGPGGFTHLRPLLDLKKKDLEKALKKAGIAWRLDRSNATDAYFRNRVRRCVLPAWVRASGRDALAGAALSRELLEEDDRALEAWVDSLKVLSPAGRLKLAPLSGLPRGVVRRALHRWLLRQSGAGDLSRQGFGVLLRAVERGSPIRLSLGPNGFALIRKGWLQFDERT